jgi:hypothetical protein
MNQPPSGGFLLPAMKTIPIRDSLSVITVDDEDYDRASSITWWLNCHERPVGRVEKRSVYFHRFLLGLGNKPRDGSFIDHRNGDPLDNRRANLRVCTRAQNMQNQGRQRTNRSGFKGVYIHKRTGSPVAVIRYFGKKKHLGVFETPQLAHEFYCLAADMVHGDFANHG